MFILAKETTTTTASSTSSTTFITATPTSGDFCLLNDLIRKFITNFLLGEVTQSSSEEATPRSTGLKVVYALVPIFVVAGTLILLDCQKNWRWSRKIYQTFSTWLPQNRKQEQQGNDEDPEVVPLQQ